MQTVWITRYALSSGIEEVEVLSRDHIGVRIRWEKQKRGGWIVLGIAEGWKATKEEALAYAETMRKERIASLRKQITKLETQPIQIRGLGYG